MDTPSTHVVRSWFEAFATNDMALARLLFPDDSILHVGRPMREYRGLDEFLHWYEKRREAAGEDFRYEVEELLNGEDHVGALISLYARGRRSTQVAVYKIADDHITDIWLYEDEPIEDRHGLELSQELQAAVLAGDAAKLEELIAEEFVLTGSPRLGILTKSEWIDAALNDFFWEEFDFGASSSFSAGESKVVSFFLDQKARYGDVDASGSFFAVDVWKRDDHGWQLISRCATRIEKA